MPITISGSTGIAGVDGSAATPAVQGTDTNTGIAFPAADTVAVATGGTERMRVDSSGNVGIGTSSPGEKLNVSTGVAEYAIQWNSTGSNNWVLASATNRAYITNKTTPAEVLTITNGGNVGIGTSSPGYRLDVRDASNTTVHVMGNTSGVRVGASADTPVAGAGFVGTYSNHPLTLGINNAERARIDTSGNFQFNSGYGSVATAYGCRAWVNFNGTGTVAIRASGNVSSITDNGTGEFTVNFTNAMPDANYTVVALGMASLGDNSTLRGIEQRGNLVAGSVRVLCMNGLNAITYDADYVHVAVFR